MTYTNLVAPLAPPSKHKELVNKAYEHVRELVYMHKAENPADIHIFCTDLSQMHMWEWLDRLTKKEVVAIFCKGFADHEYDASDLSAREYIHERIERCLPGNLLNKRFCLASEFVIHDQSHWSHDAYATEIGRYIAYVGIQMRLDLERAGSPGALGQRLGDMLEACLEAFEAPMAKSDWENWPVRCTDPATMGALDAFRLTCTQGVPMMTPQQACA